MSTPAVPQETRKLSEVLREWREELDGYYSVMKGFDSLNPDQVLRKLAAMSARFSEIRTQIVRRENVELKKFRTTEIDPFLGECDRQFKIWSRLISVSRMEYDMSYG